MGAPFVRSDISVEEVAREAGAEDTEDGIPGGGTGAPVTVADTADSDSGEDSPFLISGI